MIHDTIAEHHPDHFTLQHAFEVYVPSTHVKDHRKIVDWLRGSGQHPLEHQEPLSDDAHDAITQEVAGMLSKKFGGATITPGHGAWIPEGQKTPVKERVNIVRSAVHHKDPVQAFEDLRHVIGIADILARMMGQQSVMVTHHYNGVPHTMFISPKHPLKTIMPAFDHADEFTRIATHVFNKNPVENVSIINDLLDGISHEVDYNKAVQIKRALRKKSTPKQDDETSNK